jgi:hypothetical protein
LFSCGLLVPSMERVVRIMDGAAGAFTKSDMKYCDGGDMRTYEDKYGYRHKDSLFSSHFLDHSTTQNSTKARTIAFNFSRFVTAPHSFHKAIRPTTYASQSVASS